MAAKDWDAAPETITVSCTGCGENHTAEKHHIGTYDGAVYYEVTCPVDYLTEYFNTEGAI